MSIWFTQNPDNDVPFTVAARVSRATARPFIVQSRKLSPTRKMELPNKPAKASHNHIQYAATRSSLCNAT